RSIVGEIADPEAAAEIKCLQRAAKTGYHASGNVKTVTPLLCERSGIKNLCPGIKVETLQQQRGTFPYCLQDFGKSFFVKAKGRGATAHTHGAALCGRFRVDPQSDMRAATRHARENIQA